MRAEALIEPAAFQAIEQAVQEAERWTSGEIIPVVVDRSSDYGGVRATVAALFAWAAAVGVLAAPVSPWLWLPPAQIAAFGLGWWASEWGGLLRRLVPGPLARERVYRAARLAFLEQGLSETRERNGILLYLSLLERRVELLADRGIDARVEQGAWDEIVLELVAAIREGRPDVGLCRAIERCGQHLAASFPRTPEDKNELADHVRTGSGLRPQTDA